MTDSHEPSLEYECVDPQAGADLWRLDEPGLEEPARRRLEAHVQVCARCRLDRAMLAKLETGLTTGRLKLRPERSRALRARNLTLPTVAALAASVALLLLLPPRTEPIGGITRGTDDVRGFQRPVPGEVILTDTPTLRWSPLDGASAYRVHLEEVGGGFRWSGETKATQITADPSVSLPRKASLRARLEPIPADLAAPGAIQVTFERGSWWRFLSYRVVVAPRVAQALAGAGVLLGVVSLVLRRRERFIPDPQAAAGSRAVSS